MRRRSRFHVTLGPMTNQWPLRVREVGGVPAVPPPAVVRVATGVRAWLGRLHDRLGLPFQVLLERLLGAFHDAQAAGARLQAVMCAGALPLHGVRSVLDVGGGTGTFLAHLLAANTALTGTVVDQPAAEAGACATFAEAGVADRATFAAGDFFGAVPDGHDLHVLTAIVHDWSDNDCVRILGNCASAVTP